MVELHGDYNEFIFAMLIRRIHAYGASATLTPLHKESRVHTLALRTALTFPLTSLYLCVIMHSCIDEDGGMRMPRQLQVHIELPDTAVKHLRDEEIEAKVREAFFMELLREHQISQGKAAELIGINRHELFDLIGKYRIPVIDLTLEDLEAELQRPFPNS
jgi:predicted HTH domain antitoxin